MGKWKKGVLSILCAVLALVLLVLIFGAVYAEHLLGLIGRAEEESYASFESGQTLPPEDSKGPGDTGEVLDPTDITLDTQDKDGLIRAEHLVNILLIGQDRRAGQTHRTRSDAMILCTFDKKSKTIIMTSFLRDMYVQLPGRGGDKLNAAYAYGGMELLTQTLKQNFSVHVDACVEVDFSGFTKVIDAVGGVDIPLTAKEANYMNKNFGWSLNEGVNHLDGEKALAYSRIRAIGNDFGRTERQRKVLAALLTGAKGLGITGALNMLNEILPLLTTDMTNSQIIGYVVELFPMLTSCTLNTLRIPADGTYRDAWVGSLDVLIPDLEANRRILRDTLLPG